MTRDDILEAAAAIFSQKGYHAASMQDIAQAVHLQKASLYHHVSGKQEILLAILDQALDLLIDNMEEVMKQHLPPKEKFRLGVRTYLKEMLENRELASVLLLEHRSLDSRLQAQHIQRRDRFEQLWRELIQSGVDTGCFHCQDISITVRALLGVLNWTITWYQPSGKYNAEQIADQYVNVFLQGLINTDEDMNDGMD